LFVKLGAVMRVAGSVGVASVLIAGAVHAGVGARAIEIGLTARALQPGEVIVFTVAAPSDATHVAVTAFGRTAPAFRTDDGWKALVGIDVEQPPGTVSVRASAVAGGTPLAGERQVTVNAKRFDVRKLTVAPQFVNPPASVQARISEESRRLREVYAGSAPEPLWNGPFVRPVTDPANSRFGARSVFNGQPRNPHTGTDFLSPAGTPVKAPNAGRIVVAADLFFSGNTIVIDHGLGLFSTLAHLSAIAVEEGELVVSGAVVGNVGATGRVTGPHLHWALRVGGARVDGLSLLALPDCCDAAR
jgi:murein DD-endopeptidase MepM/ murein hydrolase activator NlpD